MISPAVPNMPWQERPEGLKDAPIWRYTENPVIGRNPVKGVARIFNSAVMPYEGEFIGVFRGEQTNGIPYIYMGRSKDAIHWDFDENKIIFDQYNRRWVKCVCCNKIKRLYEMATFKYGKGECHDCRKNKSENSEV